MTQYEGLNHETCCCANPDRGGLRCRIHAELCMQAAPPGNKQFRILLIAKAIAIINRNHVLIRLPPPLRRMRFSEATR
jgi:hypothetical protein